MQHSTWADQPIDYAGPIREVIDALSAIAEMPAAEAFIELGKLTSSSASGARNALTDARSAAMRALAAECGSLARAAERVGITPEVASRSACRGVGGRR